MRGSSAMHYGINMNAIYISLLGGADEIMEIAERFLASEARESNTSRDIAESGNENVTRNHPQNDYGKQDAWWWFIYWQGSKQAYSRWNSSAMCDLCIGSIRGMYIFCSVNRQRQNRAVTALFLA